MAISFNGARRLKKHNGYSANAVIRKTLPSFVCSYPINDGIALSPLIQEGCRVLSGQKIADLESFNSLPLHSSVSGRVTSVSQGFITVENDLLFEQAPPQKIGKSPFALTTREKLWIMREAGIFDNASSLPLHVLLTPDKTPDAVIVRCFDSDPYVSSPQLVSLAFADRILDGLSVALEILNIKKAVIAVETATRRIYSEFKLRLRYNNAISLVALKSRYPQSERETLIRTVTGKDASDANAIVIDAEALYNLSLVFETGLPVISKIVTVSGDDILPPSDFRVPIGTPVSALLSDAGYINPDIVILGGIIDGVRITDADMPVTRHTAAVLAFNDKKNIPAYRKEPI